MSKEAWAIFGALIVAVVSGLLQLWIARQNRRHATTERLREVRREVYTDWLRFVRECFALMRITQDSRCEEDDEVTPGDDDVAEEQRLVKNFEELWKTGPRLEAAVKIVAPIDTYAAFHTAFHAMQAYFLPATYGEPDPRPDPDFEPYGQLHEEWSEADDLLVRYFQYDMGVGDHPRGLYFRMPWWLWRPWRRLVQRRW